MKRILLCSLAASAVFAMAASNADAGTRKHHYYEKTWRNGAHHHYYEPVPYVRRSIDGALVDAQGWRFWNGQWDNTCFRTLDYLSSMSACSGGAAG